MKNISNKIVKIEAKPINKPTENQKNPIGHIVIKTLNVFLVPAKSRYHQFYHPKNSQWLWHLIIDAVLVISVIGLFSLNIFLLTHPTADTLQSYFDQSIFSTNKQPRLTIELVKDRDNIKTGQAFTYTINFKNEGSAPADNVMLILNLESEITGGSKKIILDSTKYPELKSVAVGQNVTVKYQTILNTKIEQPTNPNNYIVTAQVEAAYQNQSNGNSELAATSNKLIQKVSTNFIVSAIVKYRLNEGDQLGIGPLPPVVGQSTKYWIFLATETDYNDVKNISVTASLPANIKPTGRISATSPQPVQFDLEKNLVFWQVDKLPAPSITYPQIGTAFEVELIPTKDQVGQVAELMTNITATSQDQFTGEVFTVNLNNLTSKISEDSGKVITSR